MPHLKSLFPDLPPLPDYMNIWDAIIGQPHHDEFPEYAIHEDEQTGKTHTFKELKKRINDLAASIGAPISRGGLGLKREDGEMIGILSDNSSVRSSTFASTAREKLNSDRITWCSS